MQHAAYNFSRQAINHWIIASEDTYINKYMPQDQFILW